MKCTSSTEPENISEGQWAVQHIYANSIKYTVRHPKLACNYCQQQQPAAFVYMQGDGTTSSSDGDVMLQAIVTII